MEKPLPKASAIVRTSKFRHIFGTAAQKVDCLSGLKPGSIQGDSTVIKANARFYAVPSLVNGCISIVPASAKGNLGTDIPVLFHDETSVNDFNFNPFDDCMLATALNDGTIGIWQIPEDGPKEGLKPAKTITFSDKRLLSVEFHPLASGLVVGWDAARTVKIFDLESGSEKYAFTDAHKGLIANASWNMDGSLMSTAAKDKMVRILDPRAGKVAAEAADHQGTKGSRVEWIHRKDLLVTVGFSKTERCIALYDPKKFDKPLSVVSIDNGTSTLLPFYDQDLNILYMGGKGEANIRYYELDNNGMSPLSEYKSPEPQTGLCALPKQANNVMKCDVMKIIKLTPTGGIIPITFTVPRVATELFQDDLYPETFDGKASMTAAEWYEGASKPGKIMSLDPAKK